MRKLIAPLLALLMLALVAPAAAAEAVERRASVPWDEVGEGWTLATVDRGRMVQGELRLKARSLELVSPEGTRYSLYATTRQPLRHHVDPSNFTLVGWDPETRVALLQRYVSLSRTQAIRVDLRSGASQSLALPKRATSAGLRPDGTGVLTQTIGGNVLSIGWDGTRTLVGRGGTSWSPITTPDGNAAVVAGTGHLTVMPLDGSTPSELATPGECRPLRWYDDTQLLASCFSRKGSQLVTVGLDGSITPRAGLRRTSSPGFRGPSWDDTDVREVGGVAYLEGNGPCGGSFLTRENARGEQRMVRVPGSTGGISLVDARDDRLVIAHTANCDAGPPRAVLSTFDPVTLDEDALVTLGRREHWGHVLAWDEPRPWSW
ncbi:hypothetical protein [Nocardioides currus]|uniref:Uncharacterized protein n=1 Tax=Nocardioides currus TaxID=2133958 RepID=A0A2R7YXD2_9ACTN|nr:hypothetical protein [Nocardioides currus]PUA81032.1 hypothetical protein C7S10_11685 [Nocardioides currus]